MSVAGLVRKFNARAHRRRVRARDFPSSSPRARELEAEALAWEQAAHLLDIEISSTIAVQDPRRISRTEEPRSSWSPWEIGVGEAAICEAGPPRPATPAAAGQCPPVGPVASLVTFTGGLCVGQIPAHLARPGQPSAWFDHGEPEHGGGTLADDPDTDTDAGSIMYNVSN